MKVLITGGCGVIGSNAAARHLRKGDEVFILDDLSRLGTKENLRWLRGLGNCEFVLVDIRNGPAVQEVFSRIKSMDLILHLAAQVAVTTSVEEPRRDFETNALGTFNLLEAVREFHPQTPLIFSSTNKVYGALEGLKVKEKKSRYSFSGGREGVGEGQNLDFYSPYGCSKGAADQYTRDYSRIYGLKTVVMRQSCVYGPRQFGVEDQGWVAWFMIAALFQKPLVIYGNGKQLRDVLYVEDLLDCFDAAAENISRVQGEVFNIGGGSGNTISLLEFMALVQGVLGIELKPVFKDWRPGDQSIYISDISKARHELGWEPKTRLQDGIRHLHDWIVQNRSSIQTVFDSVNA